MLRTTGVLIIAVLTFTMSACAVGPERDPLGTEAESNDIVSSKVDDSPAVAGDTAVQQGALASSADDVITAAVNCTIVQFCNAPGSNGTVCQQKTCTLQAAADECVVDTNFVCGARVCPWKLITSGGTTLDLGRSCHLSRSCGKRAPCGCFCDAICTAHNDCCPDGPC
jgi:hypothetical protein